MVPAVNQVPIKDMSMINKTTNDLILTKGLNCLAFASLLHSVRLIESPSVRMTCDRFKSHAYDSDPPSALVNRLILDFQLEYLDYGSPE